MAKWKQISLIHNYAHLTNKAVLNPWVAPAFAIWFCNHRNIRFENTSKYVDTVTFFSKTWTKGHWPLDDLWPHVYWAHMCDSTQGSLCPSPMEIHQCMWIQWSILPNYLRNITYRMSDHIVSYWTQFRREKLKISSPFDFLIVFVCLFVIFVSIFHNFQHKRWNHLKQKCQDIIQCKGEITKLLEIYKMMKQIIYSKFQEH